MALLHAHGGTAKDTRSAPGRERSRLGLWVRLGSIRKDVPTRRSGEQSVVCGFLRSGPGNVSRNRCARAHGEAIADASVRPAVSSIRPGFRLLSFFTPVTCRPRSLVARVRSRREAWRTGVHFDTRKMVDR